MAKNSYVLGNRIARGGMAEIYMGKAVGEAAFQRICAIKRILPHYAQDKEFVEWQLAPIALPVSISSG